MGFSEFSPGDSNSGIPCEEMESKSTIFNMKGSISGTGYVNLQDKVIEPDGSSVRSHEHGSGEYLSNSYLKTNINRIVNISSIQLKKDSLSMRYNPTLHNLPGNRTSIFDSKGAESSTIERSQDGKITGRAAQSTTYATLISKDVIARSEYVSLKLNLSSDSVGKTNIGSRVNTTENHHKNRMHGIRFGNRYQLR